jgi:hypothetical protein
MLARRVTAMLIVLIVPGCSDLRVKEGIYANLDDAKSAGAIQAGWVPAGLPADAADLREGHLPDGRHWGVFTFTPGDADAMRALLRLEWWPRLLHTPIDLDRVKSTGFRVYTERGGQRAFAINWGQGRAYYWKG